jgi:molybdopterin molybdotransferase
LRSGLAQLSDAFPRANPLTRFVRSKLFIDNGQLFADPAGMDKSNVVISLAQTESFAVLPGKKNGFKKGDLVECYFLLMMTKIR